MIVTINQPAYLPWLGYFDRIRRADVHVVLDHVQFEKNSFVNRNKIRKQGNSLMLTVPLKTKGRFGNLAINHLEMVDCPWQKKHLTSIKHSYSKAKYFNYIADDIEGILGFDFAGAFLKMVMAFQEYFLRKLSIDTKVIHSSEMNLKESKEDLILEICKKLKAKVYISGPFGREYLEEDRFKDCGIKLLYHDYHHPTYTQLFNGFDKNLSIVDLMFNHGPDSLDILKSGE